MALIATTLSLSLPLSLSVSVVAAATDLSDGCQGAAFATNGGNPSTRLV